MSSEQYGEEGDSDARIGKRRVTVPPALAPHLGLRVRRLDADAEAAIQRISIVKLASTILIVFAVTFAVFVLLALLTS